MDAADLNEFLSGKPKRQKLLRTCALVLAWICLGLFLEITGPTLIDLKIRTGADYAEIAWAVAASNVGFFCSSAIGGILVDKCLAYCDLMLAVSLTGASIATAAVPWAPTVKIMWFIILTLGVFEGIIAVSGQKLMLMIWQEHSASPMNLLHFGFGIGSFMTPLIANPFLAVVNNHAATDEPSGMIENVTKTNRTTFEMYFTGNVTHATNTGDWNTGKIFSNVSIPPQAEFLRVSRIEFAYLIAALIILAVSIAFYCYHASDVIEMRKLMNMRQGKVRTSCKPKDNFLDMLNPATWADGRLLYGIAIFSGLFLFYFNILGGERVLGKFIRAYSIEQHGFSVDEGSYINTAFWISFSIGRFSGFVAARWIPIRILILIETGGLLTFAILLNIFGSNNSVALWVLLQPLALFHAPCFPSGMAWGNYHVNMTGVAICILLLGGAVGGIAYLQLSGFLFETIGPHVFLYFVLGYGIASFSLAIILDLTGARHGNRFEKKDDIPENERLNDTDITQNGDKFSG